MDTGYEYNIGYRYRIWESTCPILFVNQLGSCRFLKITRRERGGEYKF